MRNFLLFLFFVASLSATYLPDAGPRVSNGLGGVIWADYLYWTAREDGLGYAATNRKNGFTGQNMGKGEVKHPGYKLQSGFRLGFGVALPHDGWDLEVDYIWFQNNAGRTRITTSRVRPKIERLWVAGGITDPMFNARHADGKWKLALNVFDVGIGRNFCVSKYLSVRPHFGFKGTWNDQDYLVRYRCVNNLLVRQQERVHVQQFYWGLGPRVGFDTGFHFNRYWTLFGDVALSTLWGRFQSERRDRFFNNGNGRVMLWTENDFHSVRSVLEGALGLRFEFWFCKNRFHLAFQGGWEEQVWFGQNAFFHVFEETAHGDLTLQGLTAKVRFDF